MVTGITPKKGNANLLYHHFFLNRIEIKITHFLYMILDSKKTTRYQFSVPGLQEIHRNLKQGKKITLASPFLENPLFVLFPE